jgi:hypothetical protein
MVRLEDSLRATSSETTSTSQTLEVQLMINVRLPHFLYLFVPRQQTRGLVAHWTSSRVRRLLFVFQLRPPGLIHWTIPRIRRLASTFALLRRYQMN